VDLIVSRSTKLHRKRMHHGHSDNDDPQEFRVRSRSTREILARVAHYLKRYKLMAAGNILCAVISLGFAFVFPQLIQWIVDDVVHGKRTDFLATAASLLAAFPLRDFFNSLRLLINNTFE
jgi:ABC-type bacteriocin/lantibiotic exporter with double-glycine peptidase domain